MSDIVRVLVAVMLLVAAAHAGQVPQQRGNACTAVWDLGDVDATPGAKRRQPWTVACDDGYPPCDADGFSNGTCRLPLRVCVQQPLDGCTPKRPKRLRVSKDTAALLPGLELPPLDVEGACGPLTTLEVPASATDAPRTLTLVSRSRGRLGRSRVAVTCRPRVDTSSVCRNQLPGVPSRLHVEWESAGSDLDFGFSGEAHNFPFLDGKGLDLCLSDCDGTTDTTCVVAGAGSRPFPPLPLLTNGVPLCLDARYATPPTGTFDLVTGELRLDVALSADAAILQPASLLCPRCSGDGTVGSAGVCQGGVNHGQPCVVDALTFVVGSGGDPTYQLSGDCAPSAAETTLDLSVTLSTGEDRLDGSRPCSLQRPASDDACYGVDGTCTLACDATPAAKGGLNQTCCSNNPVLPCFPTAPDAAPQGIVRTGTPAPPLPAPPDPTYPKHGAGALVHVGCLPATGDASVDIAQGLPGPTAWLLPFRLTVFDD